jgi:hypothetical protein
MVLFTWAHNHTLDEMYYCMGDKYDGFSEAFRVRYVWPKSHKPAHQNWIVWSKW